MSCKFLKNIKGFDDAGTEREVCMALFEDRGYAIAPCCLAKNAKGHVSESKCKHREELGSEQPEEEEESLLRSEL